MKLTLLTTGATKGTPRLKTPGNRCYMGDDVLAKPRHHFERAVRRLDHHDAGVEYGVAVADSRDFGELEEEVDAVEVGVNKDLW